MANGVDATVALAEALQVPVCTTYLHNDAFPKSNPLWMGPLGYQVTYYKKSSIIKKCLPLPSFEFLLSVFPFRVNSERTISRWVESIYFLSNSDSDLVWCYMGKKGGGGN